MEELANLSVAAMVTKNPDAATCARISVTGRGKCFLPRKASVAGMIVDVPTTVESIPQLSSCLSQHSGKGAKLLLLQDLKGAFLLVH